VCSCGTLETPEKLFYTKSAVCRECYNAKKKGPAKARTSRPAWKDAFNLRTRERRKLPEYRAYYLLLDSRKSDRKSGRSNDLTLEVVQALIVEPCRYCGDTLLKRTLDRIDNTLGHLLTNVLPCCFRCNYLRRDMPFEAWIRLTKEIRALQEEGLFGDWIGGIYGR